MSALITKYGYPLQKHNVVTKDGYNLTVFRMPPKRKRGDPVFLMHGITGSSDDFTLAGPGTGLAYMLADAGYDVWMGNARGTKHSLGHVRLKREDLEYWDFSLDELALRDLPAMLKHVLLQSKHNTLVYVAHSQGTFLVNMLCSRFTKYNSKIKLAVLLAPSSSISHTKVPFMPVITELVPLLYNVSLKIHDGEIPLSVMNILSTVLQVFCNENSPTLGLCIDVYSLFFGENTKQINFQNLPVFWSHFLSGASIKQMLHLMQWYLSGDFCSYDYGPSKNLFLYGSKKPPQYNVKNFTVPVMLAYGNNDYILTPEDVHILYKRLPNVIRSYLIPDPKFNHIDFLWAKDVKKLVYDEVLKTMQLYR